MALAMTQNLLSPSELKDCLSQVPRWSLRDYSIARDFVFNDFKRAMNFANRVAQVAETLDHHPDIHISYNKMTLECSTHSAGGLTEKDFELAGKIDQIV